MTIFVHIINILIFINYIKMKQICGLFVLSLAFFASCIKQEPLVIAPCQI